MSRECRTFVSLMEMAFKCVDVFVNDGYITDGDAGFLTGFCVTILPTKKGAEV